MVCDEVCGKKKPRRDQGDMWWWNEEVKDIIAKRKATFKEASGRVDRDWFEEGGCPELNNVERRSASNCRKNGVNLAISAKGITLNKN